MKLNDLKPHPGNPRKISDSKLKMLERSLKEFGDLSGIVFNKTTGHLISGHQRLKVLPENSEIIMDTETHGHIIIDGERFSYREVQWSDVKEKAANIAANKHGGEFDLSLLNDWLLELDSENYDLDLTGFDRQELENLLAPIHNLSPGCDEDDIPEVKETICKKGDLWILGNHRLLCGDSTNILDVERLMNNEKADLWITDPPYGVSYMEKNAAVHGGIVKNQIGKEISSDTKSVEELCPFWRDVASNAFLVTTEKSSSYWFACQGSDKMMMMMMMMLDEAGWNIRHELIWVKSSFVFGRSDYHYRHEPIIYGWKKDGTHEWHGDRKQDSVIEVDRPHKSDLHPTTKPVELYEKFINNSSKPGQILLETFCGSGTAIIASEKLNRKCRAIEIDPKYCDVIIQRWEKYSNKKAIHESGKTYLEMKEII